MKLHVGSSGYSYKEWKGPFYPKDLPESQMLRYYAERFPTVEINNTFYRMPSREVLERWAGETPDTFRFVLKAPQRLTHQKRLKDVGDSLPYFLDVSEALGAKRGPFLFQLPPNMKKDAPRLDAFLAELPSAARAAFEFRHASWFDEETFGILRARGAALCIAEAGAPEDGGDALPSEIVPTASWGYLRLRRVDYTDADVDEWARRIRTQPWEEAFVFFKHEDEGTAPRLAARLAAAMAAAD
jgi:uncharacterized protein YecE (DUF72 family)